MALVLRTMRQGRALSQYRFGLQQVGARWSSSQVVTSPVADLDLPTNNVFSYVLGNTWPDHVAAECSVTGRHYTFGGLKDRALRWARTLGRLGLSKGDVVAAVMPNNPEYPILMLGSLAAGVVLTTANPSYTPDEIHRQLEDSGAVLVVCDPALVATVDSAVAKAKKPIRIMTNGPSTRHDTPDFRHIIEDTSIPFADPVEVSNEDLAVMPYSSGTTGPPKGVAISHGALTSNVAMFSNPTYLATPRATATSQSSFMCVLPFYHVYGIVPIMLVGLFNGVKLLAVSKFDPATFVDNIGKHKVSSLHLVPPMLNFLLNSPTATPSTMAIVNHILVGAAPVSTSVADAFIDKVKKPVFFQEGYGMTELLISHSVPVGVNRLGTCGQLLPNAQARVVDTNTGHDLPPLQDGEILVKTPSVMSGYFKNPKATAETLDEEGWLHTGDIGHYDEQGFFKIVDRTKELIKVKGLQVAPSELEDVLLQCPGVVEVGVVGIPNDRLGEAPRAYIITSKTVSEEEIHAFLKPRVAPHKQLAGGVVFVQELPKTQTGKLLRRELKRMSLESS